MGRLLVRVGPGGRMTVVEDGQLDLAEMGKVTQRKRLGLISPCADEPAKLEVHMLDDEKTPPRKVGRKYRLKKEAVEAETDEARRLLKEARVKEGKDKEQEAKTVRARSGEGGPPSTGGMTVRCPICRAPLVPTTVVRKVTLRTGRSDVVFKCQCPPGDHYDATGLA